MDKPIRDNLPIDVSAATDLAGLARLKTSAQDSPQALKQVAQQFEALFLEMMLKSMREASLGEGIFDSEAENLYRGMFDKQIALDLARTEGKGMGIAEMVIRQLQPHPYGAQPSLSKELHSDLSSPPSNVQPTHAQLTRAPAIRSQSAASGLQDRAGRGETGAVWNPSTPADFIRDLLPHAQQAAAELKVHPLAIIAHAAVETGWGRHVAKTSDGSCGFNLFGIKTGNNWQGQTLMGSTVEFQNGVPVIRQDGFRRYRSIAESVQDYARLLRSGPRYKEVLEQGTDLQGFAEALGRCGYATDPEYANKIKGVLCGATLRGALAALKPPISGPMT